MLAASFADFFLPPPLPSAWQNFFRGEEKREGAKRERRNLDIIPPLLLLLLLSSWSFTQKRERSISAEEEGGVFEWVLLLDEQAI